MNHHHRDLRIRTSLQRHVGESATEPGDIAALVRKVREAGVVVFLRDELERMPDMALALIEGEHARICQRNGEPR